MTAGSSAGNGSSTYKALASVRKAQDDTESLVKLLLQKRELRESGLLEEYPELWMN
jgi:hypothetical protein